MALKKSAELQNIHAIQGEARSDTSRLMSIYGTRLALAGGGGGTPLLNNVTPGAPLIGTASWPNGL